MKLITLLKSLRPHEHREFEKFLQSPFFKASEMYLQFFREIRKRSSTFNLDKDDLHAAYRRCFGKTSLNDTKWYNLASGLSKQIEQFLVVQLVSESEDDHVNALFDRLLVRAMGNRNMGAHFRSEATRVIDKTLSRTEIETDDYLALHYLHKQVYFNPDTHRFNPQSANLQTAGDYLDQYYCIEKLRYAIEMKARESIFGVQYEQPLLDAVLDYSVSNPATRQCPIWHMYTNLLLYYRQAGGEDAYKQLTEQFENQFDHFSKSDQAVICRHLINIGIGLAALNAEIEKELLRLYKRLIESNALIDDNRITHLSFINISNLAAVCHEFVWGRQFIADFEPYLEAGKRKPTIDLALAGICYYEGSLDEAWEYLSPETADTPPFDLLHHGLALKITFDQYWLKGNDYQYLVTQMETFSRFIRNKKLTKAKKSAYLNWINFVRKMTAVRFSQAHPISNTVRARLLNKLHEIKPMVSKNWTAAKLSETPVK